MQIGHPLWSCLPCVMSEWHRIDSIKVYNTEFVRGIMKIDQRTNEFLLWMELFPQCLNAAQVKHTQILHVKKNTILLNHHALSPHWNLSVKTLIFTTYYICSLNGRKIKEEVGSKVKRLAWCWVTSMLYNTWVIGSHSTTLLWFFCLVVNLSHKMMQLLRSPFENCAILGKLAEDIR